MSNAMVGRVILALCHPLDVVSQLFVGSASVCILRALTLVFSSPAAACHRSEGEVGTCHSL
jgi:Na+-translocating ferredoxin:NAD+ oxidoreductase RnfD subunit